MSLNFVFDFKKNNGEDYIVEILNKVKKHPHDYISFFDSLILAIESNEENRRYLVNKLSKTFTNINFIGYLVDSGIYIEESLLSIFRKRIGDFLLPEIEDNNELSSLVNEVFYDKKRYDVLRIIPKDRWERFFNALLKDTEEDFLKKKSKDIRTSLLQAMVILTDRITGGFSGKEMMRYSSQVNYLNNPFSKLSLQINRIVDKPDLAYDHLEIKESISICKKLLNDILTQKDHKGISLKVAAKINILQQQLTRLQSVLNSFHELKTNGLVHFYSYSARTWIEFYSPKNWLSNQLSSTIYLITFLVTYHNGKTGEKYITSTAKEYHKMFWTACGGGLIVAFLCYFKTWIGAIPSSSLFFKAFAYSINYAIGFTTIYLLHWTLATKQPSMTAARLAGALVKKTGTELNIKDFTILFAQLCRSQMIAFLGNVIAGFSVAMLLFVFFNEVLGMQVIKYSKAYHYWEELVVMDPVIFYYAGIAGVFLFISGLVSGITINNQRFNNVPERVFQHPILKRFFGVEKRRKIASWVEHNNGGVVGNIVFGFLMGFAFIVGEILGIPFDIRHITFAAGNFAIGIGGMDYHFADTGAIVIGFISIFLIGLCNFLVSFGLSLFLAFRSNQIPFYKIFPMSMHIIKAFFTNPLPFFIPPIWTKSKEEAGH